MINITLTDDAWASLVVAAVVAAVVLVVVLLDNCVM